ncbi:MAG TPA: hypothetical protein VFX28_23305 [Methylomirabilota bacterium]|nr:hypothetical protein [Methylomirabilota bacterium]
MAGRAAATARGLRRAGALVLLVLAGCAGTAWPRGEWVKPGVTAEARRRDEYECERRATRERDSAPPAVYAECMRARGYRPGR